MCFVCTRNRGSYTLEVKKTPRHLTYTHCGGEIKLIAFVTEPAAIRRILEYLTEPTPPPLINAASFLPIEAAELDPSIPDAGSEASPAPEVEFDQTVSG